MEITELGLTNKELEAFKTFYFLVFSPNPMKNRVKVYIDDGSIKTSMKISSFIALCVSLIGPDVEYKLAMALEEVGCFFILDRKTGDLRHLQLNFEKEAMSIKKMFDENHAAYEEGESAYDKLIQLNNLVGATNKMNSLNLKSKFDKKNKRTRFF